MSLAWACVFLLGLSPSQSAADRLLEDATRLRQAGQWSEAIDLLGRAATAGPLAPGARNLLVELLLRQQDAEGAHAAVLAGLRETPDSAYLHLGLGDACWLLRDLAEAQAQYRLVADGPSELAATARERLKNLAEDLQLTLHARALEVRASWLAAGMAALLLAGSGAIGWRSRARTRLSVTGK